MKRFKFNMMEFVGALGDIGTFIPIFISLVIINGLNPNVILLVVGLLHIFCGFYYNLPIPVQPLKAGSAIAITKGLSVSIIQAEGILIGIILLFLSITGFINFLSRIFKRPIIRGVQLGVGLMLMNSSLSLITKQIGVSSQSIFFPRQEFNIDLPSFDNFITAFFLLVIPQLPLTLGNAIVSTKDVARRYFGDKAHRVNERSLSMSMGITNIIAGLSGGMPVCHGAAGLTAHYSFGARTGGSGIIIGSLCLALSLILGKGVIEVFRIIPYPILGLMLFYVGLSHSLLIRDLKDKKELLIALVMGLTTLFTGNLAIAYVIGISLYLFHRRLLVTKQQV